MLNSQRLASYLVIFTSYLLVSCSVEKQIAKSAKADVLDAKALQTAHVGISIFDPAANKYLYNYQGDKYFVPASNTKIPTCYAAMKYLGDSLVGLRYGVPEKQTNTIVIRPSADPTFMHSDYKINPAWRFLQFLNKGQQLGFYYDTIEIQRWGNGWSWNDYDEPYMAERNQFPVFGNVITVKPEDIEKRIRIDSTTIVPGKKIKVVTKLFTTGNKYFDSLVNKHPITKLFKEDTLRLRLSRNIDRNDFFVDRTTSVFTSQDFPFVTDGQNTAINILKDSLKKSFTVVLPTRAKNTYEWASDGGDLHLITINNWNIIHSQPTDSLLKPMMHRSDNFFAEQSLLMVSNEMLGVMNDAKIIDTILKTDFKDLPQKPRWVDGSGLSRYNLFTPQDFVAILNKIQKEFPMARIKEIFPTGGEGTISSYYKTDSGYIYGKTGTLSGVVAFSGFLYTKKGKLLIFSTLVNNHQASATDVRRAIEKFLQGVRNKY